MRRPSENGHRRVRAPRALVTGGAGFVGSHLAESLLRLGYRVSALDNLTTGRTENVAHLLAEPDFELVVGDVRDEELVERLVATNDVVFHLAAAVGVKLILDDPLGSMATNLRGTEVVLERARAHDVKVLVASTSEVYGKVAKTPQREDDDVLLGPTRFGRWSYAASKMLDEFLALAHFRESGLPVVVFRLFNTVGPRQTGMYGMVVPRFVEAALRDDPLQVYGDGLQSRCFLHVRDAVEAIVRLAHSPRAVGGVFNVGGAEEVTILDLARRVLARVGGRKATNGHKPISLVPYEQAYPGGDYEDIRCRVPDIGKIRRLTRWQPKRTLDEIIDDVIADKAASHSLAATVAAPVA
jgi:UDP-glucose 4-epimerase